MIRYKEAPALTRASRAPEEQLTLVRDEVAPCQAQLARWKIVPWLLPLATLTMLLGYSGPSLALGLVGITGLCLTQQERRLWGVARKQQET